MAAVVGVFAVVVAHVVIDQKQFHIDAMQQEVATAQARETALQYRLAELEAPQRIIAAAEQLGMVMPASVTYLTPAPIVPVSADSGSPVTAPAQSPAQSSAQTSPTTSPTGSVGTRTDGR